MLNFFTVVLIILIIIFIVIFKRKYIFNAFNKKKVYPMKEIHNENNIITSSAKKIIIIKIALISTQSFIKEN